MNKGENNNQKIICNTITITLLQKAINCFLKNKTSIKEDENEIKSNNFNNINIDNINNLIDSIKKIEKIFFYIFKNQTKYYLLIKRNFAYLNKLALCKNNKIFKEIKINKIETILSFFILLLKNYLTLKRHDKIKQILLLLIRLTTENVFPSNTFSLIVEIFINLLIMIININPDKKYSVNDEPFLIINDIIETLITYPKGLKFGNLNNYILLDIISLFDKYLIIPYYPNICFKESSIYLKLLENHMLNPLEEFEIDKKNINNDNNENNDIKNIQKKLYLFLIKIYKFSMKDEYFQTFIIKKGIINLEYYVMSLNYLLHLFQEEEHLISVSSFKIINGFHLQKDNFLFLPNIKLKNSDFSIIFSFKIDQIQQEGEYIKILNIYQKPEKSVLNLSIDENNYLNIIYNGDKKWKTYIKIQEKKFYLVCISPFKKIIGNSKLCLYINESVDENIVSDKINQGFEIQGTDSCFYYKNKISLDMPKEALLELGKDNFVGVIGEFLIINKNLNKSNIHHLFNLKEKYSKILSQIYNNYEDLFKYDSPNFIKSKFGINKLSDNEKKSIDFFKQLDFNIILEIMTYKINKFNNFKYFSKNSKDYMNNSISTINIKDKKKENNENNLSILSISQIKNENININDYSCISENNNSICNNSNFNTSYIYQKDSYRQENINININLFTMKYSSIVFYQNKGLDFLTLQLHNMFSTINEPKILYIYLYESLSFMYKFMLIMNENIIDVSVRNSPKLDNKISIFFLSLLTLLNKKENIILNNNIILKLLDILDFFRFNQLFVQRNMILSILLDVDYYENRAHFMKYPKLIKTIISDLEDDSNNDNTIINLEILYKILLLDFIFETKENNHKLLMKLISSFICFDKYKKGNNSEIEENITYEFINYIISLKNEIKLYHYLKIIYLNSNKIRNKLKNNEKFLEYINMEIEKINSNHCKYCAYNQILFYLINVEIYMNSSSENDYIFHFNPTGFMKNPNFFFIKSIFSQFLCISNENKLKFIKTKLEGIDFILSIFKNNEKIKNSEENKKMIKNKFAELLEYNKFIPKFKALVDYMKFLFDEIKETVDTKLLNLLNETINLIMSFIKQICLEKKNNLLLSNNRVNWSIVKDENINQIINTSEQHSKENKLIKLYDDFIKELFCSKGMKILYNIYLSINYKEAIENLNYFVDISIYEVYNPFYYYLLSSNLNFNNELNNKSNFNDDSDENINQYIKCQLLKIIGKELIKSNIIFDELKDKILVQNNILFLIYIYHNLINNAIECDEEFEEIIDFFLNFLRDNFFINSKYIFNINSLIDNNSKDTTNNKFIIEIIADILFIMYDKKNFDLKYHNLIKNFLIDDKLSLMKIDEQYFLDSKDKGICFKFFNQIYLHNVCKGVEVSELLFTIYFLYYLCEKNNKYKAIIIDNKSSDPMKLINEIISNIFIEAIQLYNNYYQNQKIILVRKHLLNKYPYKIYKHFMLFIADKYKEKSLTLDKLMAHYDKLILKKNINFQRKTHFLNQELFLDNNSGDNMNPKNNKSEVNQMNNYWGQPNQMMEMEIKKEKLSKNAKRFAKSKSKFKSREIKEMDDDHNLENKLKESKRSKSYAKKHLTKIPRISQANKSSQHLNKILKKITLGNSDNESEKEKNNNRFRDSIDLLMSNNENKDDENIVSEDDNNENIDNKNNKINKKKNNSQILISEPNENSQNDILMIDNENNECINKKSENKRKNKTVHFELPFSRDKNNDNLSDSSDEENIGEEYDIKKKLKYMNIPSRFYRNIFHLSDSKTMKILFNPKEYYIWNKFTLILKKIIFHNKKFDILTKIYNMVYKKLKLQKSKYYLKYPTKLKNFICDDYYRPFIKPDIYFFNHKLLPNSLSYVKKDIFNINLSDEDNLCKIKFRRILPINYDIRHTKKIICEIINNNGSIYGHIYFNHAFLLFISDTKSDPRSEKSNNNLNEKQEDFFLYSYFLEDRLKNKKKYVIIYFSEIKEIIIRRFCLNYVGYEIFMKDNKSHLFNFFNKKNLKKFIYNICEKLELSYKNKPNTNNPMIYLHNENILSLPILYFNINQEINFSIINDPLNIFEKNGYKMKYQKGEISNFKYLLLINKYSSRSYKDNNQYLIFPLLYMDKERKINRDLSKAICLNKSNNEESIQNFKENFESSGNHFNTHYSTSAYILYYLVRLIPFTFGHIKLQSGNFDAPERMFSSFENYLLAMDYSDENRELCPELFSIYEAFINLNHFSLGYIQNDKFLIDDFYSNNENGIFEFIINLRQRLEKANIIPWIDNIFGSNQIIGNDKLINIFPLSSYEQFNNFEEMKIKLEKKGLAFKEIVNQIKANINLLSLGVSPIQLFKTNHPLKNISTKRIFYFFDSGNNINSFEKTAKSLCHKNLNQFINTYMTNKYQIYSIENDNNNYGMKLVIKSKKNLYILKMYYYDNNKNNKISKLELWKKKQIKIEPLGKVCCELSPGIFCFCRYIDKVIQIKSEKQSFLYQYKYIITSVEFFSHNETKNSNNTNTMHINELLFGDEEGFLNLMQIKYEINNKKSSIEIGSVKIIILKQVKVHNSFIQGISYIKRLNIIISYSEEGQITINNAYSFNIINIIELGEKYFIKDIKISNYDLIYIHCINNINENNYIKCYSLNGTKVTKLKSDKKINNFFITEEVIIVYENNIIEVFNLYNLRANPVYILSPELKQKEKDDKIKNNFEKGKEKKIIVFCDFIIKDLKMVIIYQDHEIIIQDILPLEK